MRNAIPDMEFDILWEDELIGHAVIKDGKVVSLVQKECHPVKKLVYRNNPTMAELSTAIEGRCWERGRADLPEILDALGLKDYNPFQIILKTHATDYDDKLWVRFKGENLTWKDVNPHRG